MRELVGTPVRVRPLRAEDLTGRQKAAVLLMALGADAASRITQSLTPEELEAISFEIARLESVPVSVVEAVLEEWQQTEQAAHTLAQGGVEYARQILERALGPQKAAVVLKRIESQLRDTAGFRNLRNADPQRLSGVLRNEHPQTIAFILAHLEPYLVAEVIKQLPASLGASVLYRMARMAKVLPEVLQVVERSLRTESELSLTQDVAAVGGPPSVAAVLNLVTGTLEQELLDGIAQWDEGLREEIQELMFVFTDLTKLDDRSLQRVVAAVELRELALALRAAPEEVKRRIRSVMSQRAVSALEEEMELLGPVRLRDAEAAQASIVRKVRALEEAGEIVLGSGADDILV
ncbi:MAG TPA: flagellar motor switch protein FliG [Longimicrobiales bacterium]|jgi:flagellar motor switch protein FliG